MNIFLIEIHPKKSTYDPLARSVRAELIEAGELPEESQVNTQKLFKISGPLTPEQAVLAAETLLMDPVVEMAKVNDLKPNDPQEKNSKNKESKQKVVKKGTEGLGWVLDVWPKAGVTDPVGETVEKGLHDLGFKGEFKAQSATRYIFPKIKSAEVLKKLTRQVLANELIHDITITRQS